MTGRIKKMIKITILLMIVSHFLLFSDGTIKWETDWKSTLKTAVEKKQPALMDFYTDWCPPCKKLAAVTFKDADVIEYFKKENYVLIKLNPEKDRVAESTFKVFSYPTLIVYKPDGTEFDRMLGYKDPKELIQSLEDLKKGIGTLEDLLNRYKKEDKSNKKFKLMFAINDKYIARADYPQALKMIDRIIESDKDNTQKQASSAMYQTGYIYYKWKKYKKAIAAMFSIHKVYPGSEEAASGYTAAAYYAEKIKDTEGTLKILKNFVKDYPNSKYAERSRKKIGKLENQ